MRFLRRLALIACCVAGCATATEDLVDEVDEVDEADEVDATSQVSADATAELNGTVVTQLVSKRAEFTFNTPGNNAQHKKVIRLINAAPKGSEIRIGIYSISEERVYKAIKRAQERGVKVFVVHSGEKREPKASNRKYAVKLRDLLNENFRWCSPASPLSQGGCISTDVSGLMHAKYMLLSQTEDSKGNKRSNVVWYSSANFTESSGINKLNNSTTIYGDEKLYKGFKNQVWDSMWQGVSYSSNDYYDADSGRGYFGSDASNSQVYVSPEQDTDLVDIRLGYVRPEPGCEVRVMQAWLYDTRPEIAKRLVDLKNDGCKVWVVAETVHSATFKKLNDAGIAIHHNDKVHDKAFVIYAKYGDEPQPRYIVLNGSHNLSLSALTRNDELLVKLTDDKKMYDAFVHHFNNAYKAGKVMTAPNEGGDDSDS